MAQLGAIASELGEAEEAGAAAQDGEWEEIPDIPVSNGARAVVRRAARTMRRREALIARGIAIDWVALLDECRAARASYYALCDVPGFAFSCEEDLVATAAVATKAGSDASEHPLGASMFALW